mmetsp:Transcript_34170/g.63349  ORF Transcript_34170/g.63349 Transcript_34170/m.63349 type:complete len:338 (-) Transcript_34170:556-1569(-)
MRRTCVVAIRMHRIHSAPIRIIVAASAYNNDGYPRCFLAACLAAFSFFFNFFRFRFASFCASLTSFSRSSAVSFWSKTRNALPEAFCCCFSFEIVCVGSSTFPTLLDFNSSRYFFIFFSFFCFPGAFPWNTCDSFRKASFCVIGLPYSSGYSRFRFGAGSSFDFSFGSLSIPRRLARESTAAIPPDARGSSCRKSTLSSSSSSSSPSSPSSSSSISLGTSPSSTMGTGLASSLSSVLLGKDFIASLSWMFISLVFSFFSLTSRPRQNSDVAERTMLPSLVFPLSVSSSSCCSFGTLRTCSASSCVGSRLSLLLTRFLFPASLALAKAVCSWTSNLSS